MYNSEPLARLSSARYAAAMDVVIEMPDGRRTWLPTEEALAAHAGADPHEVEDAIAHLTRLHGVDDVDATAAENAYLVVGAMLSTKLPAARDIRLEVRPNDTVRLSYRLGRSPAWRPRP